MRLRQRLGGLLAAAGMIAFCSLTGVMSSRTHAQSGQTESEYQTLVQQALREYQLGNFSEAKAFFTRANALSPNARTLRGMGMSAYELRNYVESIDDFQQALSATERPLTPQMRSEITQLLSQARSFVTKLQIKLAPRDAELRIDTRPVKRDGDGSVLLDPGTHEVFAEAPEHESTTRTLRTNGGETLSLNITLRPTSAPISLAAEASPPLGATSEAPEGATAADSNSEGSGSGAGPWVLIGSSGAVAIAGGVLLAVALSNKNAVEHPESSAASGPVYADYESKDKLVFPLSVIGITALSLGVAGVVGGLVWKLSSGGSTERPSAQLQLGPGGATLHARF
ncbi:MAG: hypothetical protein ABW321_05220 [Polyangiales bacterium]